MLEDIGEDNDEPIILHNVNEKVLELVIEWCKHHKDDKEYEQEKRTIDIDEWDQKFMEVDQETLFDIILAANYLDIKHLLNIGCKTVANMIKEEEEQIKKENEWAEDR
ncbi:hypothetical protein G6F33_012507 [Rhizopus arrhizus]|nr:hypothetical protein G6F33_012507 [Rhizopus arrhizus]